MVYYKGPFGTAVFLLHCILVQWLKNKNTAELHTLYGNTVDEKQKYNRVASKQDTAVPFRKVHFFSNTADVHSERSIF